MLISGVFRWFFVSFSVFVDYNLVFSSFAFGFSSVLDFSVKKTYDFVCVWWSISWQSDPFEFDIPSFSSFSFWGFLSGFYLSPYFKFVSPLLVICAVWISVLSENLFLGFSLWGLISAVIPSVSFFFFFSVFKRKSCSCYCFCFGYSNKNGYFSLCLEFLPFFAFLFTSSWNVCWFLLLTLIYSDGI